MAVGTDQLAGHDHDRPDQEIDDDLLGIADRLPRKEVARYGLPQPEAERGKWIADALDQQNRQSNDRPGHRDEKVVLQMVA